MKIPVALLIRDAFYLFGRQISSDMHNFIEGILICIEKE